MKKSLKNKNDAANKLMIIMDLLYNNLDNHKGINKKLKKEVDKAQDHLYNVYYHLIENIEKNG